MHAHAQRTAAPHHRRAAPCGSERARYGARCQRSSGSLSLLPPCPYARSLATERALSHAATTRSAPVPQRTTPAVHRGSRWWGGVASFRLLWTAALPPLGLGAAGRRGGPGAGCGGLLQPFIPSHEAQFSGYGVRASLRALWALCCPSLPPLPLTTTAAAACGARMRPRRCAPRTRPIT